MSQNYAKSAFESSKSGDFAEAGDYYTQAAYQALAHDAITAGNDHQVGGGLDRLLRAALCYQRASLPSRARNRSEQGVLITRDLQQNVITDEKRSAVLQEFVADFHGIGNLEGADQAYRDALEKLAAADVEYTVSFHSVPIADSIIGFSRYLVQFAEREPDVELIYDFAGRVAFKRDEMETIVRSVSNSSE